MLASVAVAGWYTSFQLSHSHLTEPLWFAAWGAALIGVAMVIRRLPGDVR